MKSASDRELLRAYAERREEQAFAELVQRHIDFVYSVALRTVHDSQLAEDVAQAVFLALAKQAPNLTGHQSLAGWLHRTSQNLAANVVRSEVRRRQREEKAADMTPQTENPWDQIAPELDHALSELNESDRDLILRRYFQKQTARDISRELCTSEEAAQKRLSRAVERLRHLLLKRNVSVGSAALTSALTSSAVQAAPTGLAGSITSALLHDLGGHAIALTTTKVITMTTTQKALVAVSLAAVVGTGVYEVAQTKERRDETKFFAEREENLHAQVLDARELSETASAQIAALRKENERLHQQAEEIHRLRADITGLREEKRQRKVAQEDQNRTESVLRAWLDRTEQFKGLQILMPDEDIPELALLTEEAWLDLAKRQVAPGHEHELDLEDETKARNTFAYVRLAAKKEFGFMMSRALGAYVKTNAGTLPPHIMDLLPHFETPIDPAMLARYEIVRSGMFEDVPAVETPIIVEVSPADPEFDQRLILGKHSLLWAAPGDPNYWDVDVAQAAVPATPSPQPIDH